MNNNFHRKKIEKAQKINQADVEHTRVTQIRADIKELDNEIQQLQNNLLASSSSQVMTVDSQITN